MSERLGQQPEQDPTEVSRALGRKALEQPEPNPNAQFAHELLSRPTEERASLEEMYEAHQDEVHEVELTVDKPSVNIMHIDELLLGHKDSAYKFFSDTVDILMGLPKEMKPDAIVVSGLLQGDFKLLEKRRRNTLVPELSSMDKQFYYGKQVLDKLADTELPVIYNMSNDDRRIAEEYTIEVFRKMLDLSNSADKVNYYQIDKMKTHPKWQEHLQFQNNYVFPYCLRAGRRLRSAEEMSELSEGELEIDEYMLLYDTYKRLEADLDPNEQYLPFIDVECLGDTNFTFTDDVNLRIKTSGNEYVNAVRHYMNFSPQPMYQNHMKTPIETIGQMKASGEDTPDMLVLEHNQEAVGVNVDGTWVVSNPGLLQPERFMNSKGSKTDAAGDISRRLVTTRRRIPHPAITSHEQFDDGRHIVTIFNEALMSKAESCERTALPLFTDWQIGSLTARPDLLVKFLEYVQEIDEEQVWYMNGDFIQGRNYPNFPNENQQIGLITIESQIEFVHNLLQQSFYNDPNVKRVVVQPGNHEWNSGTEKWHGYTYTRYIRDMFKDLGVETHFGEGLITDKGEAFKAYATIDYVGDYGVYVSHLPLLKGAKGNNGLPIYQAQQHTAGVGEAKRSVDFELYGHWHHPQYGLFGDKLAVISGSIAGLSGYEWQRGYRPIISGVILHVGGGLPPQLEFLSEQMLHNFNIIDGNFSVESLKAEGYTDDEGFDSTKHGIFMPSQYPKSALQKKLLKMIRDASEGEHTRLR